MYIVRNYYTEEILKVFEDLQAAVAYCIKHEDSEIFNGTYCVFANIDLPF